MSHGPSFEKQPDRSMREISDTAANHDAYEQFLAPPEKTGEWRLQIQCHDYQAYDGNHNAFYKVLAACSSG